MQKQHAPLTITAAAIFLFCGSIPTAWANKSATVIETPAAVAKGTEVTITIKVLHEGNNFLHHTKWANVKVNGEEKFLWDFGWFGKPESNNFTRTIILTINEPTEIVAEARCNIHGGEPPAKFMVNLQE